MEAIETDLSKGSIPVTPTKFSLNFKQRLRMSTSDQQYAKSFFNSERSNMLGSLANANCRKLMELIKKYANVHNYHKKILNSEHISHKNPAYCLCHTERDRLVNIQSRKKHTFCFTFSFVLSSASMGSSSSFGIIKH